MAVAAGVEVHIFGDCFGLIGRVGVGVGEEGVSHKFSNMFLNIEVCSRLLDFKPLFDILETCGLVFLTCV